MVKRKNAYRILVLRHTIWRSLWKQSYKINYVVETFVEAVGMKLCIRIFRLKLRTSSGLVWTRCKLYLKKKGVGDLLEKLVDVSFSN